MQIILAKPPNHEEVSKFFNLKPEDVIFYTYGDKCYNPSMVKMPVEIIAHEEIHIEQQNANEDVANLWWQRYMKDPVWRVEQEAEAYGAQYAFVCRSHKDRNYRARYLDGISKHLSGPIYGNAIDYQGARRMILEFARDGKVIPKSTG